jgi:Na+/melibiose symporter-like transporter
MTHAPTPPPTSLGVRVGYGSGAIILGIGLYALGGQVLQIYFNQVIGLPPAAVGAALMVTILVDAVIDPLIGWWSDSLRTRWGRRHILMYASAIPTALGLYALWHAPPGLSAGGLMAFMIGMLLFVRIASSLFEIPSLALAPELAPGYDERTSLLAWRFLFLVLGGVFINAVLYQVFLRQDASNPLGLLNRDRYAAFGSFAAILVLVVILASTAVTHSRIKYLHVPAEKPLSFGRVLRELAATFSNRPLLILMFTNFLISIPAGVTAGLQSYVMIHLWGFKPQDLGLILMAAPFSSFLALWATPRASIRWGKKPVMLTLYGSWLVCATVPFSLWLLHLTPAAGSIALLVLLAADMFLGAGFAVGVHIILNTMLSDATEDVAVSSHQRSEGVMFAAYGLLAKWGTGAGAFVAGLLLQVVHFPEKALPGTVPLGLMRNLILVNLPTITLFNLAAIALVSFYALDRRRYEANQAVLRARAAAAEADTVTPEAAAGQAAAVGG